MTATSELRRKIVNGAFDRVFGELYADVGQARERYIQAVSEFEGLWGEREVILTSAPGRTELGGNHTDHQRGMVLAAAVNPDVVCVVSRNNDKTIRVHSEGHGSEVVELDDLTPRNGEVGRSASLIRGIASWFSKNGYNIGGFDAYITSDVLTGSGLSSSAAFEVAVGCTLNALYNDSAVTAKETAIAGQYAENKYFGKPSGLMDQMASSVGGFVHIDFAEPDNPVVTPITFDFDASGYELCVVDTGGSHADLTAEYAAITVEMRAVAEFFGKKYLREVDEDKFISSLAAIRAAVGDRAVLRAAHFFKDNANVKKQAAALSRGDFGEYLRLVDASGRSSFTCLQNIYAAPRVQGISVALALSERLLSERGGAWRVHGGGFAGTIQAYAPKGFFDEYRAEIDKVFGDGACRALRVRRAGGIQVTE